MPETVPEPTQEAKEPAAAEPKPNRKPKPVVDGNAESKPDRKRVAKLVPAVEALVLTAERPIPEAKIAEAIVAADASLAGLDSAAIEAAIEQLNAEYDKSNRAFRVERVAGGWRAMARPEHARVLAAFHRQAQSGRLSRPALETLAVIAYRQPVTRARLEAIRGVGCGEVLRSLLDRRLITVTGRAEELGRPMLYGTTKRFLDTFGLASLKELPAVLDPTAAIPNLDSGDEDPARESGGAVSEAEAAVTDLSTGSDESGRPE